MRDRLFPLPDVEMPTALTIGWIRWLTFVSLAWFILSWDLGVYGYAPDVALDMYPVWVLGLLEHRYPLTAGPVIDLVHFHWIHWFAPIPDAAVLRGIQLTSAVLCLGVAVFGRGPRNALAIAAMIAVLYVFGFLWRSGIEYTSMGVLLQIALLYACTRFVEPVPGRRRITWNHGEIGYARFVGVIVVVLTLYYLFSGVNKLIDLPLADWMGYDLYGTVHEFADRQASDHFRYAPVWLSVLAVHPIVNIGVPLVYVSHMFTPLMILRPLTAIPAFALFYTAFHLYSLAMNIFFYGVVLAWLTLLPVHRVQRPVHVRTGARMARWIRRIDCFGRIRNVEAASAPVPGLVSVHDSVTGETLTGAPGIRRLLWALPLAWPLWPFVLVATVAMDAGLLRRVFGRRPPRSAWVRRLRASAGDLRPGVDARRATALAVVGSAMALAWMLVALWMHDGAAYEVVARPSHAWWIAAGHALFAVLAVTPALRARWLPALFSGRIIAWAPLIVAALIANHFVVLSAFRQLLWGTLTLSALIVWWPVALRLLCRARRPVERPAAVYVVMILAVFAVPGLIVPPLSSGIEGWTRAAPPADSRGIHTRGMALVREDSETAWYGQPMTAPAYWSSRVPFTAIPRRARFLEAVGVIDDADQRRQADLHAYFTWYAERYERAWPLLADGYLPHQRWLGPLAWPTHDPGRADPADYADFPPDRIGGVGLIGVLYDRESGRQVDMRFFEGAKVDLTGGGSSP